MAVPYIANIYPNSGHSGGTTLVRMLGWNFGANVEVSFDTAVSDKAFMIKHGLAYAVTPISPLSDAATGSGAGAVDVTLKNLDSNGDPIPGETVTVVDGFTYTMPDLYDTDLSRTVRQLIVELRRQVISEVVIRKHTDYVDAAGIASGRVQVSSLPAIVLIGPQVLDNRIYASNALYGATGERFFVQRRPAQAIDLQFTILGAAEKTQHQLSLLEAVLAFFRKNSMLYVDRNGSDPTKGQISYDLDFVPGGYPAILSAPNGSNVTAFTGTVGIVGVRLEGFSTAGDIPESDMVADLAGPPPADGVTLTIDTQLGEGAPPVDTGLPNETAGAMGIPGAFEPLRIRRK